MKKFLPLVLIIPSLLFSEKPLFVTRYRADSLFIFLVENPQRGMGFEVWRRSPGEKEFKKLTPEPIKGIEDPTYVRQTLGEDYDLLVRAMRATDDMQLLRRLRRDDFAAGIFTMVSFGVANLLGRLFIDTPVEEGREYEYRVRLLDENGTELRKEEKRVKIVEILPIAPKGLSVKEGDEKVELAWKYPIWKGDEKDLAFQFRIYRRGEGEEGFKKVNYEIILREEREDFTFIDVWLKNGMQYEYYVAVVDPAGNESEPSQHIFATPKDITPPQIPTGLNVSSKEGKVLLRWNMGVDLDLACYNVYRSKSLSEEFIKINTVSIPFDLPEFVDTTGVPGTMYFYEVANVDSSGNESKHCNPLSVILVDEFPPEPPRDVEVNVKDTIVCINWSPSPSKDVMGYYIYRGELREHLPKIVSHSLPPETRSYIDKGYGKRGFKAGGKYFIGVSAVDSSRNESEVVIHEVQIPDLEPPLPPNFVSVKNLKNGWIEVSYGVSLSLDLSHYVISRVENGKQTKLIELKDKKPWVDSNVVIGKEYRYGVSSVDTIGNEGELLLSEPIIAKDAIPPTPPTELKVILKDKGVELNWKPSDAPDLLGYNVYRSDLPNGLYKKINKELVKETGFFDPEGRGFQWYRVKAVDISENESLNREKTQPKRKR